MEIAVMYPTETPSKAVQLGPFELNLAIGATVAKGQFPLVVMSHGSGGSNLGHRSLAMALSKKGFVVAMPLHPGNNYKDDTLAGSLKNYQDRPKHLRATINRMLSNEPLGKAINRQKIAVIGHSMGGYSALAAAGGMADTGYLVAHCQTQNNKQQWPMCQGAIHHSLPAMALDHARDERIKAVILMAPMGILFASPDALSTVNTPVLLLRAEKDLELTEPYHSDMIHQRLANNPKVTYKTIANAGHYAFITPFPDFMKPDLGPIAQDPTGFDREAFHTTLATDVIGFLSSVFAL
ncbi:hypothetical protein ACH42_03890 [Endozoicomonas sp. (ex Bugula neritina AB1)]|nr:hypothetical protein ACH42_03890 [Endozoicomonas sp. (ex Bugula neritina AB1)]